MPSSKWWSGLSTSQKKAHLKKHPNSVYARGSVASVPGGKKSITRVEPVHPLKVKKTKPKGRLQKIREWKEKNPGKVKAIGLGLGLGLAALKYYRRHMNDD